MSLEMLNHRGDFAPVTLVAVTCNFPGKCQICKLKNDLASSLFKAGWNLN